MSIRTWIALCSILSLGFASVAGSGGMTLSESVEESKLPLTTEQVWELDPGELNPHLRPWILEKSVALEADSIQAITRIHLREGVEGAAARAAHGLWVQGLRNHLGELGKALAPIRDRSSPEARTRFRLWLQAVDLDWRKKIPWPTGVGWPSVGPAPTTLPIRAPSHRWGNLNSIRVDALGFGHSGKSMTGQFLIDPGSPQSQVSPIWLRAQGVPLAEHPPAKQVKISTVEFQKVKVGGVEIPLTEFQLREIERFSGPDFPGNCCDGVLGIDFIRLYAVDFQPRYAVVILHPRLGFSVTSSDFYWSPIRLDLAGRLHTLGQKKPDQPALHWTADLSNGRIGWSTVVPVSHPIPGLKLAYRLNARGDRELRAVRALPSERMQAIIAKGFSLGTEVLALDGISVREMDRQTMEDRIGGVYGDTLKIQWRSPEGIRQDSL